MNQLFRVKPILTITIVLGLLLAPASSWASEVSIDAVRARTTMPRVHSNTHAISWARMLLIFKNGPAASKQFYVDANPQLFDVLMTAIKIDANIEIRYESTTNMVTSIAIVP
jgi:hypothetical protein